MVRRIIQSAIEAALARLNLAGGCEGCGGLRAGPRVAIVTVAQRDRRCEVCRLRLDFMGVPVAASGGAVVVLNAIPEDIAERCRELRGRSARSF